MSRDYHVVAGKNAVRELLLSPRAVAEILFAGRLEEAVAQLVRDRGIPCREVTKVELNRLHPQHQNIVALTGTPIKYLELTDVLQASSQDVHDPPLLVLTDGIQDPRNLGAAIRVADAAGAHGLIIPRHRAAPPTATVVRAAAGATAHLPLVQVTNLNRAMSQCKQAGLWLAGLDAQGDSELWQADLTGPLALVLGSEHKGLRRLVREECDYILSIPMFGRVNSLNASTALAVALYEVRRQRRAQQPSVNR